MLPLLWGCSENPLIIQVRYAEVLGLKQNDPVYFDQNKIGEVQKVTYTQQGDYLVEISITPDFKNTATEDSKFFIGNDPVNQQTKAVIIMQEKPGGKAIEQGTIVQGSVQTGLLDEMMSSFRRNAIIAENEMRKAVQQLEKSLRGSSQKLDKEMSVLLDDLSRQFREFNEEIKKVPDSREVKQLEESIRLFAEEFNKAQENVRDHIRNEVIPQLRKELDRLREQLHEEGREKETETIDKKIDEMSRI
jgi:paraquat-inducible protein B